MTLAAIDAMPMAEFESWAMFMQEEPFGEHIADLRAGQICATVANVHRDPKAKREPFGPLDFVPWNPIAGKKDEPIKLVDPKAQQELIERTLFAGLPINR